MHFLKASLFSVTLLMAATSSARGTSRSPIRKRRVPISKCKANTSAKLAVDFRSASR